MERIGIVGSREGVDLEAVKLFIVTLHAAQPESVVVSGGARGVDKTAEDAWLELGGSVISFRPYKVTQDSWGVQEWRLGPNPEMVTHDVPTFADPASVLFFRSTMIVEISDRLVSFTNPRFSPGTRFTKYMAHEIPSYEIVT